MRAEKKVHVLSLSSFFLTLMIYILTLFIKRCLITLIKQNQRIFSVFYFIHVVSERRDAQVVLIASTWYNNEISIMKCWAMFDRYQISHHSWEWNNFVFNVSRYEFTWRHISYMIIGWVTWFCHSSSLKLTHETRLVFNVKNRDIHKALQSSERILLGL